jgi:hypothetical protein
MLGSGNLGHGEFLLSCLSWCGEFKSQSMTDENEIYIDASTFQHPLEKLAEVMAQKVKREAPKLLGAPPYVAVDLHVLVRQAIYTYNLLFYLNADERRETDCYWRNAYSIVVLPLIRNMIDCLYNITAILQDPSARGKWFRKSGYKKLLEAFNEDEKRYARQPKWGEWIRKGRDGLDFLIRADGMKMADVLALKSYWPTLGTYIGNKQPGGGTSPHQDFLRTFTFGYWRKYSAMAHGAFEGLMPTAMYYIVDSMPHEERPKIDDQHTRVLFLHIGRAAGGLLCIITELQAHFHFDDNGARINERIHEMWNALMPVPEIKELYDERYAQLMNDKRIEP